MNSLTKSQVNGLALTASIIFIAFLNCFFIKTHVTSNVYEDPEMAVSGVKWLVITYLAVSLVLLLGYTVFRKGFDQKFLHFQILTSAIPFAYLVTAAFFLIYAVLRLGTPPLPHHPGPESIGLSLPLLWIVWIGVIVMFHMIYIFLWRSGRISWILFGRRLAAFCCCVALWILFFLVMKHDPFYFYDWLGS
jgi:hypothetical protein